MFRNRDSNNNYLWLIPVVAVLAILPLIVYRSSCGHDLLFHVQSWISAAAQLRHGQYPRWTTTAAWNAGEPRFVFYPPLSWLLGALLTLLFPVAACPAIFILTALIASGLTFHHLARQFTGASAAIFASALYLANPYMLFCAFERCALAELLAAAWIPLLLLGALRPRPTIRSIAFPIALLWLTNAPAAVIGCYALAIIATLRILCSLVTSSRPAARDGVGPEFMLSSQHSPASLSGSQPQNPSALRIAITFLCGGILGLALPAFYLIPAAYQRRFVQISMAIIPGMAPGDNFLFAHTSSLWHDAVNHTVSILTVVLLALTAATITLLSIQLRHPDALLRPGTLHDPHTSDLCIISPKEAAIIPPPYLVPILCTLVVVIAFLLTPISISVWNRVPELVFIQFPWRLLIILTPILILAISLLFHEYARVLIFPQNLARQSGAVSMAQSAQSMTRVIPILAIALPLCISLFCFHLYHQACYPPDTPADLAHLLATHHGTLPTDEYTPTNADNNLLRSDNPGFWLIPESSAAPGSPAADPNAPAPHTIPTATQLDPSIDTDDTPIPLSQTISAPAPHHLTLHLSRPSILVLNLRDYPSWRITNLRSPVLPRHLQRLDGLTAIALPPGTAILDITWRNTPDQLLGLALSIVAALIMIVIPLPGYARRRRGVHLEPAPSAETASTRVESL